MTMPNNTSEAKAAKVISSFKKIVATTKAQKPDALLHTLSALHQTILSTNQHDPLVRNTATYLLHYSRSQGLRQTKEALLSHIKSAEQHITNAATSIADAGHPKIRHGSAVFVYGVSPAIIALLLKARQERIPFEVHTLESQPLYNGRSLASLLSKHKIPVRHYADLALRIVLKKADVVLLTPTVIADGGRAYCQIGSELIAETAQRYDVPVYVVADSWQYDPSVARALEHTTELRSHKEIWAKPPKHVEVLNYGFEKVHPQLVAGFITELGILKPNLFDSEIKQKYPLLFKK